MSMTIGRSGQGGRGGWGEWGALPPDDSFRRTIATVCDAFTERTEVAVSPEAREFIYHTLSAFVQESHPYWQHLHIEQPERLIVVNRVLEELPDLLDAILEIERQRGEQFGYRVNTITYFGLLFYLQTNLVSICQCLPPPLNKRNL